MQRRKTRTKRPELVAALAAALALAGCGSGSERRAAPQPRLAAPLAAALAARSDEVVQALEAGDSCTAAAHAQALQEAAISAINAGRIPGPLQEPLGSSVSDLVSRIHCVKKADEPRDRGKHKGRGKHGKGHEGDD
ncbi:MAG TPA: hypothetical protein VFU26_14080 [Gaiellaceae bacterium]|nr:hypothetical protein [Gaiellaceae bacterium]